MKKCNHEFEEMLIHENSLKKVGKVYFPIIAARLGFVCSRCLEERADEEHIGKSLPPPNWGSVVVETHS